MAIKVVDFGKADAEPKKRRLADLPDRVVAGDPHHESKTFFENQTGDTFAGKWTSTPGKWHVFPGKDEFCYIVSGHVRLIAEDGSAQTFKTGDSFLIPNGFRGYWEVVETTTKYWVTRRY